MKKALKTAARGTVFPYAGEKWVVLEHDPAGRTLCLRLEVIPDKPFDEDNRTNFAKEIAALLRETYGSKIKVFGTEIPHSVRAKEISAEGKSIFAHDPNGKVAEGYKNLTKEVIKLEKQREKSRAGSIR